MKSSFAEHLLPNGLHVISETMPQVRSTAVAFLVRTGARHETPAEHGVSHFLEHMCFKGSAKRCGREINVAFDQLGSIYNAFTGREHTVYYGWVPAAHAEAQLELLADMMRPTLPHEEFETERRVVLEEIAMAGDSFDHSVSDFLHQTCFENHALAHEILGEQDTIETLPRESMIDYHSRRYAPGNMHLLASGAVDAEALIAAVGRHCGEWRRGTNGAVDTRPPDVMPTGVRSHALPRFKQQSLLLVYPSLPEGSPHDEAIDAFVALFGGANSRCYWNIVQKGICTHAGAAWLSYGDCGLLAFYADGEPQRCEQMLTALREQIRLVAKNGVGADEVERVTNRRRTQLALESENPRTRLMQLIDDIEARGYVRPAAARLAAVEAVNEKSIARYLEQCPITGDGLLLSVGPRDWPAASVI